MSDYLELQNKYRKAIMALKAFAQDSDFIEFWSKSEQYGQSFEAVKKHHDIMKRSARQTLTDLGEDWTLP